MPDVILVDKKLDKVNNREIISLKLQEEIKKNLLNKEQTIIFINKRGYSSYLTCTNCSYVFKCPNCDVAMTYHKKSDLLLCHYCRSCIKKYKSLS